MSDSSIGERTARRKSRPAVLALGALFLPAVMWLDYRTGVEFAFAVFYLFPILFVTWYAGRRGGVAFAVLSALGTYVTNYVLAHRAHSHPLAPYWETFTYLLFFLVAALAFARLADESRRVKSLLQLKTDMLSLVSHEFSNNLAVMTSALYLLKELDDADPDCALKRSELYEMLERVYAALRTTSETFLDQIRMESGVFALNVRTFDVRTLIARCEELMSPLASQKSVALKTEFPAGAIRLRGDPDALALVFSNLVGNAIKYTPAGGVVTVRLSLPAARPGFATISVEDTGIGIPERDQSAVFSGFYRTEEGRRAAKGTGLGLKVAKEIVARHSVPLELESAPGKGSRFFFDLPLSPAGGG